MSRDTPEIAAARIEAEQAWAQLSDTARELQAELEEMFSPQTWARDIWEGAKSKGADLAEEAVDVVRKRPGIASGVVAAIALFFAREPLIDMAGKLADGVKRGHKARPAKARTDKPSAAKARPRKPSTRPKATETIE
ncbi:MAG: hypothetical protein ABI422_00720 [Sphingomicrobium sp.]